MSDLFVSYARSEDSVARRVAVALREAGYSVWCDEELPAHRVYAEVIQERLTSAKSVVVLWSAAALKSQWVRSEADAGRAAGKLVQATLDGTIPPMPFDQIQCADLRGWNAKGSSQGWDKLLRSVAELARASPSQDRGSMPDAQHAAYRSRLSRRPVLMGAGAAVGAAALGGVWTLRRGTRGDRLPPEAAGLLLQAKIALWQNTAEGQNQAIGMYRRLVVDYPDSADGWGYLSTTYSWVSHYRQSSDAAEMRSRAISAARKGLELEAGNRLALVGQATARPYVGNWLAIDEALRKSAKGTRDNDDLSLILAHFLAATGHAVEALGYMNLVLPTGPTPALYAFKALSLWSAGRPEEVDNLLAEARQLYPTHYGLWFTRYYVDMLSGRPEAALGLAADSASWPSGIDPDEIHAVVRLAKAVQAPTRAAVDGVAGEWMERARAGAGFAENASQFLTALGRIDDAFKVLRAYYFSEGFDCGEVRFNRLQGTFTPRNDRLTAFLFNPALAPLRDDRRFGELTKRLHLAEFWEATENPPDYLDRSK